MIDVSLNFDDGRLNDLLQLALKSADALDRKIDEIQASLKKGFAAQGGDKFSNSLKEGAKSAQDADAALKKFGVTAGLSFAKFNLLAGVIEQVGGGLTSFITEPIRQGATLESLEANFTTLLKSGEAAKQLIAEINKFAAETPFSQSELFQQTEKLLGFGFAAEDVTDILRRLGDISGGSAEKLDGFVTALAQVQAKGRLQGEELLQFAERGLGTNLIAEALGQTTAQFTELVSQGKIGYGELEKAIKVLTDEGGRFNGVMAAQSQTLNGLFSTLVGNFEQLQGEVGKLLLPALKDVVIAANDIIAGIDPKQIGVAFDEAGQAAQPFLDALASGFDENILPALLRFRDAIQDALDRASEFFSGINEGGAVTEFLKSLLDGITEAFGSLVDTLAFAIEGIVDFASPIVSNLIPAIQTVFRVVGGAIEAFSNLTGEGERAGTVFDTLAQPFAVLASALSTVVEVVGEVVAGFLNLGDNARSSTPWIRTLGEVVEFVTIPVRALAGFLFDAGQALGDFLGITETATEKAARLKKEADAAAAAAAQANAGEDFADRQRQIDSQNAAQKEAERLRKKEADARKAAATKTQKELEKEAKDREKFLKDQADLRIELIEDETARAIEKEKQRFEAEQKEVKRLFGKTKEFQAQQEAAARIHAANIAEIEKEAADKVIAERSKVLEREKEFEQERQNIRAEAQLNAADNAKNLGDLRLDIAEAAQVAYLQKLKQNGASEQTLQKEQARFDLITQSLRLQNEIEFQEALLKATAAGDEQRRAQIELQLQLLRQQLANVTFEINTPDGDLGLGPIAQRLSTFKESLAKSLKLDVAQFDTLFSGAKSAFSSFFDSINAIREVQIAQNERLIESLDKQIAKQEEAVEKEKRAKELGASNSLDIEQRTLDELQAKKEAAEKKNQELQARSARFQLLQDTAQQASGIATSVVNIIKGTSAVPFVGIALAAIQVAALFALIASARAQAKAATKLYKGGKIPLGKDDEHGTGYKIEGTNIEVGGGEFVLRRKVVDKHETFIEKLNSGKYDHLNLERELNEPGESKQPEPKTRKERTERVFVDIRRVQRETIAKAAYIAQKTVLEAFKSINETNETEKRKQAIERSEKAISKYDHLNLERELNEPGESKQPEPKTRKERTERVFVDIRRVQRETIAKAAYIAQKTVLEAFKSINETNETEKRKQAIERSEKAINIVLSEITNNVWQRRASLKSDVSEVLDVSKSIKDMQERKISDVKRIAKSAIANEVLDVLKSSASEKTRREFEMVKMSQEFARRENAPQIPVVASGALARFAPPEIVFEQQKRVERMYEAIKPPVFAGVGGGNVVNQTEPFDYAKLASMLNEQSNRIIRQGFYPLQRLGDAVTDKDGKLVVRSTDAAGNLRTDILG